MKLKNAAIVAVALMTGLLANDCAAQKGGKKPAKGKDAIVDSTSYAYGMILGYDIKNNFDQQKLPINKEEFARAVMDVLKEGGVPKMEMAQAEMLMMSFGEKMQKQQMEEAQKAAAEAEMKEREWFVSAVDTKPGIKKTESGLRYEILKEGTGAKPTLQSKVTTHYHGTFTDGKVFDSSVERGQPATFPVGGVIPGWTEILQLMPVGSKWRVYIPFKLAYGEQGAGEVIPPFTPLVFEIELISIN